MPITETSVPAAGATSPTIQFAGQLDSATGFFTPEMADLTARTTLAAILAKIIAAPATDATLAGAAASLVSILAKLPTSPALDATLSAGITSIVNAVNSGASTLPTGAATQTTLAAVLTALQGNLAITAASLPLPAGAATSAAQTTAQTSLTSMDGKTPALGQALAAASTPVVLTAIQLAAIQQPASGSATSANSKPVVIASDQAAIPITAAALPLPTGAATDATLTANGVLVGPVTETAPASDTASAGLNGRMQRIAQRLTSLIAATLAISVADGSDTTQGAKADTAASNSTSPWSVTALLKGIYQNTIGRVSGQLAMASSLSVVTASDDVNIGPTVLVNSSAVAAVNQLLIPSTDISLYGKLYLHLTNAATGCTFILQCSNDNTNWDSIFGTPTNQAFGAPSSTLNGARMIEVPGGYKWFRCICSVYGSGSPTAVLSCSPKGNSQSPFFAATITPIPVVNQGPATFFRGQNPATTGGPTNVKSLNAIVAHLAATNAGASDLYLQLYNKASAPVLGTDIPNMTYRVKAGTSMVVDFGPFGSRWSNGFSYAFTSDYAGATGVTAAADGTVTGLYT